MAAAKAEIDESAALVPFKYKDHEFRIPKLDDWSVDIFEYMEDNRIVSAVRELLGEEQWKTFKSTKPSMSELGALFEAASTAQGVKSGESRA